MTYIIYELVGLITGLVVILGFVYNMFLKPLIKPEDYIIRAVKYEVYLLNKGKAIKIIEDALQLKNLTDHDRCNMFLYLGELYYKRKIYSKSASHFLNALDIFMRLNRDANFNYREYFLHAIEAFLKGGHYKDAIEYYEDFIKRECYDSSFNKLRKVSKILEGA